MLCDTQPKEWYWTINQMLIWATHTVHYMHMFFGQNSCFLYNKSSLAF